MAKNLLSSALWIVENGYFVVKNQGEKTLHRHLIDTWGVQLWVESRLDDGRYISLFRVKARGIYYDIHCLLRVEIGKEFYEYWLMKVSAKPWAGVENKSMFLIAKGTNLYGPRQIIERSERFFDSYQIDSNNAITLPKQDLQLLYDMEAWNFPKSYESSSMIKTQVIIDENGRYIDWSSEISVEGGACFYNGRDGLTTAGSHHAPAWGQITTPRRRSGYDEILDDYPKVKKDGILARLAFAVE